MEKRTKLALVIIVALLLLLLGLYFLFSPFLPKLTNNQPPALPSAVKPYVPPPGAAVVAPSGTGTVAPISDLLLALQNEAKATVERIGSGGSTNGFLGYHDALLQMTPAGQAQTSADQLQMQQAHPATGPTFGISTRAVSASVVSGAAGDAQIVISVDAIQNEDNGDPTRPTKTSGKRVTVTFAKQSDDTYLIDSLSWSDFQL